MNNIIQSRDIGGTTVPGLRVMTVGHRDTDGNWWPAGTEFMPLGAGRNNLQARTEQTISIAGQRVTIQAA